MNISFPIKTGRLLLRPVELSDAGEVFNYRSDKNTNRYQGWIPGSVDDTVNFIKNNTFPEIDIPDTWFQLVIMLEENNVIIGDAGIHFLKSDNYQAEIGCTLNKKYHGNGYATESLKAILDFLFLSLNKHRIIATIDHRNKRSISLVKRLGFRKEGHFRESSLIRNEWVDDLVFGILKHEWISH